MFQADFGSFSVMIYASVKVGIEFALKHWTISSRTHKTLAGAPACASNRGRKKMQRCLARNLHKHCFCLKITYPEIHEPHQLNHISFFLKLNCLWVHTTFSCLTAILLALPAMNKDVRALSSKNDGSSGSRQSLMALSWIWYFHTALTKNRYSKHPPV